MHKQTEGFRIVGNRKKVILYNPETKEILETYESATHALIRDHPPSAGIAVWLLLWNQAWILKKGLVQPVLLFLRDTGKTVKLCSFLHPKCPMCSHIYK
jgi:hypothetical protein